MTLVGIIGGNGDMGKWLRDFFKKNNCDVTFSDLDTSITNEEVASKSNIVIVAVPIKNTVSVIKEVGPLIRKESLFMDVSSLKVKSMQAMMIYSKSEVIGTHPMFAPSISISGQTVVLCKGRVGKWYDWLLDLLKNNNAVIKETTPEKHDKLMGVIQGLLHFNSVVMVNAMKEFDFDFDESLSYTSPVYRLNLNILCRILNKNPKLYTDIVIDNTETTHAITHFQSSLENLKRIVVTKNKEKFEKIFCDCASYLGEFKKNAEQESDKLIELMVKLDARR